jgi:hypothetical protein
VPIILCGHASNVLIVVFVAVVLLVLVVVVIVVVVVVVVVVCNINIIHGHCGVYFHMPIFATFNLWQLNKIFP